MESHNTGATRLEDTTKDDEENGKENLQLISLLQMDSIKQ